MMLFFHLDLCILVNYLFQLGQPLNVNIKLNLK